jgi:hypothetical protein
MSLIITVVVLAIPTVVAVLAAAPGGCGGACE